MILKKFEGNMAIIIFISIIISYYFYKTLPTKKKKYSIFFLLIGLLLSNPITKFGSVEGFGKVVEKKENNYVISYGNNIFRRNNKFSCKSDMDLYVGDMISFKGNLKKADRPYNENGFDEFRYLKSRGVGAKFSGKIKGVKKRGLGAKFSRRLIYSSMFLDEDSSLTYTGILSSNGSIAIESESYRELGISHIFSFSGLHVGLIVLFLSFILRPFGKNVSQILSLIVTFFYIYVIGFPVSAVRAYIMLFVFFLARINKFKYRSIEVLLFSFLIQIAYNPYQIFSVGLLLSYFATLGILIFIRRLKCLGNSYISNAFRVSFGATIMTLPIVLRNFYMANPFSIIANLIVVPLYSLGVGVSFLHFIYPNFYTAKIINFLFGSGRSIGAFLNVYFKSFVTGKVGIYFILCYYILVFLAIKYREISFDKFQLKAAFLILLTIFPLNFLENYERYNFRVDFMYVAQGDSCIFKYDGKYYMVDTGGNERTNPTKRYLLLYLLSKRILNIEALFVSHYDADHIEGLLEMMPTIKFLNVYANHFTEGNKYAEFIKENLKLHKFSDMKIKDLSIKEVSHIGETENDKSLAIILNYKDISIFFTGDLSKEALDSISLGEVTILKVPHHGSMYSVSEKLFEMIRPKYSVISYGPNNYRMPSNDIMKELSKYGEVLRTKKDGQISFIYDKKLEKNNVVKR